MDKIRVGILGYGNLGKGVELALAHNSDMELAGIFTRRQGVATRNGQALSIDAIGDYRDKIDVLILCGGSATDLPEQGKRMLAGFNTVDSFDTHARIPEHFAAMDEIGKRSGHLGIISVGWDPGLFSIARLLFGSVLPNGKDYTFWGRGVSQGHSDAIRRIDGVLDARQYTVPVPQALDRVRSGENPELTTRQKHTRECYVVAAPDADRQRIEREIVTMPNYFADYDTTVHFIDAEQMRRDHAQIPHGGFVIRSGDTYSDKKHLLELRVQLDSNPEFTSSVLVAYARAIYRMHKQGRTGCVTVFDVPLGMLSQSSADDLRAHLL